MGPAQRPSPACRPHPEDADELHEGELLCSRCACRFPVLGGVAILDPEPEEYVRQYWGCLRRDLDRYGDLSRDGDRWLTRRKPRAGSESKEYGADFRFSQQFEDPWNVALALWGESGSGLGEFGRWLESAASDTPYDVLDRWAVELDPSPALALDAGCGGGGLAHRLAGHCGLVFGVDRSFLAVLLARRTLLHRPRREQTYLLRLRPGQEVERPIPVARRGNVEMVAADACSLPFAPSLFDLVCSSNLIDMAGIDSLHEAVRVLSPRSTLFVTDPFLFPEATAPAGDPRDAVRQVLETLGLDIVGEEDGVPWIWTHYDRHWRIYLNYCVRARRARSA